LTEEKSFIYYIYLAQYCRRADNKQRHRRKHRPILGNGKLLVIFESTTWDLSPLDWSVPKTWRQPFTERSKLETNRWTEH